MRSIGIHLILLFASVSSIGGVGENFSKTVDNLLSSARVITAITIQNGLISESFPPDEVISALMQTPSVNFTKLEVLDEKKFSEFLKILETLKAALRAPEDPIEDVLIWLNSLRLQEIQSASETNLPLISRLRKFSNLLENFSSKQSDQNLTKNSTQLFGKLSQIMGHVPYFQGVQEDVNLLLAVGQMSKEPKYLDIDRLPLDSRDFPVKSLKKLEKSLQPIQSLKLPAFELRKKLKKVGKVIQKLQKVGEKFSRIAGWQINETMVLECGKAWKSLKNMSKVSEMVRKLIDTTLANNSEAVILKLQNVSEIQDLQAFLTNLTVEPLASQLELTATTIQLKRDIGTLKWDNWDMGPIQKAIGKLRFVAVTMKRFQPREVQELRRLQNLWYEMANFNGAVMGLDVAWRILERRDLLERFLKEGEGVEEEIWKFGDPSNRSDLQQDWGDFEAMKRDLEMVLDDLDQVFKVQIPKTIRKFVDLLPVFNGLAGLAEFGKLKNVKLEIENRRRVLETLGRTNVTYLRELEHLDLDLVKYYHPIVASRRTLKNVDSIFESLLLAPVALRDDEISDQMSFREKFERYFPLVLLLVPIFCCTFAYFAFVRKGMPASFEDTWSDETEMSDFCAPPPVQIPMTPPVCHTPSPVERVEDLGKSPLAGTPTPTPQSNKSLQPLAVIACISSMIIIRATEC